QKDLILAATKDVGEDSASAVIYRMPEPAWCFLVADETPHFIDFGFVYFLNVHCKVVWIYAPEQRRVDRLENPFLFFNSLSTVSLLIPNTRAVSRIPLPLSVRSMICRFT